MHPIVSGRMFRDFLEGMRGPDILQVANFWMSNKGRVKRIKNKRK